MPPREIGGNAVAGKTAAAWRPAAPSLPQRACFDTAFHQTLTAATRTYALPQELRDQGFRRFGFHGLNHQHISQVVAHQWTRQGRDPRQLRLISAHLGAGPERWHR